MLPGLFSNDDRHTECFKPNTSPPASSGICWNHFRGADGREPGYRSGYPAGQSG
jgi:hypothetical protein